MDTYFNEDYHIKKLHQLRTLKEIDGLFSLDMLKAFNHISHFEMKRILGVENWPCPGEFFNLWDILKMHGLFHFICALDENNIEKLRRWYIQSQVLGGCE